MISYRGEIIESKEKAKENKSFLLYHLPQPEKKGRKVWKTSSACAGWSACSQFTKRARLYRRLPPLDRSLEMDEICGRRWETQRFSRTRYNTAENIYMIRKKTNRLWSKSSSRSFSTLSSYSSHPFVNRLHGSKDFVCLRRNNLE